MRHRVAKKKLSRDKGHRTSLQRNLSRSLILDGKVETTLAKAKFVQPHVEKLVTKAKRGSGFTNVNRVNAKLRSKEALRVLFDDVAVRFANRPGGYTRIVKLGYRKGDMAPLARIEWVEGPKPKKSKTKTKAESDKTVKADKTKGKTKKTAKEEKPEKKSPEEKKTKKKSTKTKKVKEESSENK